MHLAVFDTNVWLAGLNYTGASYQCLQAVRWGQVQLAYCSEMLAELSAKLRHKYKYPENHIYSVIYRIRYTYRSKKVTITNTLHIVSDPDDDKFVECAVIAGAKWIVSSDKHLLSLKEYNGILFVTPAQFLTIIDTMSQSYKNGPAY